VPSSEEARWSTLIGTRVAFVASALVAASAALHLACGHDDAVLRISPIRRSNLDRCASVGEQPDLAGGSPAGLVATVSSFDETARTRPKAAATEALDDWGPLVKVPGEVAPPSRVN
jgi:hypothetical protein